MRPEAPEKHEQRERSPAGAAPRGRVAGSAAAASPTQASRPESWREPWLTKRELAGALRCSRRTIERLRLPALRVGGQNRYRLSEVEAYLRGGGRQVQLVLFGREREEEPKA